MADRVEQIVEKTANVVMARMPEKIETIGLSHVEVSPDDETKKLQASPTLEEKSKEAVQKLKAPDMPEQVKRVNGIVLGIHARREERARLVAELKRQEVSNERQEREGREVLEAQMTALRAETERAIAQLNSRFHLEHDLRLGEVSRREAAIEKLDVSLDQLRKQLDAELGKLDPERKVPA